MTTVQLNDFQYTDEQKQDIINALRAAAVAQAEVWDALRAVEIANEGVLVELDSYFIGTLAGECSQPPSVSDLDREVVWDSFLDSTTVTRE